MRSILLSFLFLFGLTTFAQNVTNHQVKPKGVYKEINLSNDIRVINVLLDTNLTHPRSALIDSIERDANKYTPPVLYALSNILFVQKKYDEACFWFYVAQLRARYDVNRCADKTADASAYNQSFGPIINEYASKHLDTLKMIIPKVVDFVRSNEEQYDQRWINLSGMGAMTESLGGKSANKELSIARGQWPAIKKKTIDTYYSDFKDALGLDNDDNTVDRTNMLGYDYQLFKGTPAWELAKAVQNGDTTKIRQEVNKNKNLLSFTEPKFGQPLLSLAVMRSSYNSVKTLLELGADPNMQDLYYGDSPLMKAADIGINGVGADPRFLKLLLKYGGDPNAVENGPEKHGKNSVLIIACGSGDLDYVEILVDAGAKVNAVTIYDETALNAAVNIAGIIDNPDMVIYLIRKGADYKRVLYKTIPEGENKYITDAMRYWRFDLGSDEYKKKMELVDFLKKNGMDYRKTKIPEEYIPDYPKDYLDKY